MKTTLFPHLAIRISFIILALSLTFISCKKDSSGAIAENRMTLTVDGSSQTLIATTIVKNVNTTTGLKLYSTTGTSLSSTVSINIACITLEKKTYQVLPNITDIVSGSTTGGVIASFVAVTLSGTTTYSNAHLNASGTVTITEVTSTYIKGTYDMVLVSSAAATKAIKGEFYSLIVLQ